LCDAAAELAEQRKSLNAWKKPGNACIEVEQTVHRFTVADPEHPLQAHGAIHAKLARLNSRARRDGYMPDV
jgi:hypothetical protein